jgi:hypothetical protein
MTDSAPLYLADEFIRSNKLLQLVKLISAIENTDTLQNSPAKFQATDTRVAALPSPPLRTHNATCIMQPPIMYQPTTV